MRLSRRARIFLALFCVLVVVAGVVLMIVGKNIASGRMCVARTNVHPQQSFFDNDSKFATFVQEIEQRAQHSLVSQFDREAGLFIYNENPSGERSSADNDIRQLLAARVLALASYADETLVPLHEENLSFIMREWYREEQGSGYVYVEEKSKLGANALLLRLLVASPHFERYSDQAAALARGIEVLVQPDGLFVPWFKEPAYEYDADRLLAFYSGEALLALLEYADKVDDRDVQALAVRVQDAYIRRYVGALETYYYPAYVPWHTQSLALLYIKTGEKKYADALFTLNDKVLELQDTQEFVGRFYNPATPQYGSPHGSSDAVYTEGLAYAYEVAVREGDTVRAEAYKRAIVLGVHNLSRLQYESRFWVPDNRETARRLRGGIMTNVCNRDVRIDTTAHSLDAFVKIRALWSHE